MTIRNYRSVRTVAAVLTLGAVAWVVAPLAMSGGQNFNTTRASLAADPAKDNLSKVEADVDRNYSSVKHMTAQQFTALQKSDKETIVFDVREASEYQVSRIDGAERLDPGIWTWSFMRKHADRVKGKNVVFYCSVGVRSSKLAARFQQELMKNGAKGVYNLRGGMFRWHNDQRPLSDAKGKTPLVHPYDKHWGRLINRQSFVSYKPKKPAAN